MGNYHRRTFINFKHIVYRSPLFFEVMIITVAIKLLTRLFLYAWYMGEKIETVSEFFTEEPSSKMCAILLNVRPTYGQVPRRICVYKHDEKCKYYLSIIHFHLSFQNSMYLEIPFVCMTTLHFMHVTLF